MIKQYLYSLLLWIIEDFNTRLKYVDKSEIRRIANEEFSESDIVSKLAWCCYGLANINYRGNDIVIKPLDFGIELKFLRNFKSQSGYYSSKTMWKEVFKDFDWLEKEINRGYKGKRALVICWFNAYDYMGEVIQLGKHAGQSPKANEQRIKYFPFLRKDGQKTKEYTVDYEKAFKELTIKGTNINCIFVGRETDKFHIVLYW
jgi:hypothetical protein